MSELYLHNSCSLLVLYGAVLADMVLGDRDWPLHPVRVMGAAVSFAEKRAEASSMPPFWAGTVMSVGLVLCTLLVVHGLLVSARFLWWPIFVLLSVTCIYFGLCLRCLADEAGKVVESLLDEGLDRARRRLSMLVSRDTALMDETDICRSLIETVAENFVDGVCSPFFYACLGGPALCLAFKMVSTLDSMVGYRNDRYEQLGKCAARMDDLANFVPARLSVPVVALAGLIMEGRSPVEVVKTGLQDARTHESPNSGFPEAAFAHVLGVSLGGPVCYDGVLHNLPYINAQGRSPTPSDVRRSIRLLYVSAWIFYLLPILVVWIS